MPAAFGFMRSRSEGPAAGFFRWGRRLDFTERSSMLGVDGAFGDRDATEKYSPNRDHACGRVSPLPSPEHPIGHANKRAHGQHHWRFGHGPRMPGDCTPRVGQYQFLD